MARWLFSRDVNMTLENVISFLHDPSIASGAGNPAAKPSCLQDWGLWNMETGMPTEIGQSLLDEKISWQECILLLLSKRSSQTDVASSVKPLVVICKAISQMIRFGVRRLSKSSCAKYLIPINNYNELGSAVNKLLNDANPTESNSYLDIWFNALVQSRLFEFPKETGKTVIELAHTDYAEGVSQFIALYGDKMRQTPAKDGNKPEYYSYLGSMYTGLAELLNPVNALAKALPHFIQVAGEKKRKIDSGPVSTEINAYLTAIRTKPFLLLAGISGTGKSRLARQLARATAPNEWKNKHKPGNYELIPVKPNWHDSTELLGYVSRISGKPEYVMTDFVWFLFKAMLYQEIPFFLCLDEMNLASVEQYFAEYLSVIETRARNGEGRISMDVLVKFDKAIYNSSIKEQLREYYNTLSIGGDFERISNMIENDGGLRIPSNFVVIGTVNMDETTFSFSRKVLDRAMSFELNVVNMNEGVEMDNANLPVIPNEAVSPKLLSANDAYNACVPVARVVLERLENINKELEGTPFKIAYRSRNEIMVYVYERMRDSIAMDTPDYEAAQHSSLLHQAMDEAVSMKILSRIEGDEQKIDKDFLTRLENAIKSGIAIASADDSEPVEKELYPICTAKIRQMQEQLKHGYVSFWS